MQTSGLPSLVVFGGSGYLGSRICQEALKAGLPVTGVSRSGRPANEDGAWCNEVTWHSANALYPESYTELLRNSLAVISTIGLISASQEDMLRMNGEANKALINAAADAGVGRFAYVSAHDYQFPGDLVLLRGYFQGKRDAEATLAARFPDSGACHAVPAHSKSAGAPRARSLAPSHGGSMAEHCPCRWHVPCRTRVLYHALLSCMPMS